MTRYAFIADIHGNLPALDAVISDIHTQSVDGVWVGGDLVGRGPQGHAVVGRIAELGWPCIRGNHEDYLLKFRKGDVEPDWLELPEWAAVRWMAAELSDDDVKYIDGLPLTLRIEGEKPIRLVHGTPDSHSVGIGPWTADKKLVGYLERIEECCLVCAHTHRSLERRLEEGLVINTGSVGLPFNGIEKAQYIILTEMDGDWQVEFRQVEYDRELVYQVYESSGFLATGGVYSWLLMKELECASTYLVPFLKWCEYEEEKPSFERLEPFLALYDPAQSIRSFYEKITGRR
jgi:predicted phosphodiesterase